MNFVLSTPKNKNRTPKWEKKFVPIGIAAMSKDESDRHPGPKRLIFMRTVLTRRSSTGERLWCFPDASDKGAITQTL